jgi:hypothetical protein
MDRQIAIDRITETENLTDGLEDDDANWLLDWGIGHVDGLVTGIADEDAAGDKLNQLMAVMRTLNQIASNRAAKPPDALAADIRTFLDRYQQAFGVPEATTPTPTAAPAQDAKTPPTTNQTPSTATAPSTAPATSAAAPKDGQSSSTPPAATPPATQAGVNQPNQPPAATTANLPALAKKEETPPSTNAADQVSQAPDQSAEDQSIEAATKIAGMTPKEAMQYLLSLAEAGASAA